MGLVGAARRGTLPSMVAPARRLPIPSTCATWVTSSLAPPAPLEAQDPERVRWLKLKIRDRVSDVRRHLVALRTAMAEFGEDFDLDAFQAGHASQDPIELNRVKAVERGVDQLYNYIAELSAFGLELAEVRRHHDETNARRDLAALSRIGVLGSERARRLERLHELRRMLVHEYATATAEQVHEAARILADEFLPYYGRLPTLDRARLQRHPLT